MIVAARSRHCHSHLERFIAQGHQMKKSIGFRRLWKLLSDQHAEFVFIPRVLAHEMPDDWQQRLVGMIEEYNAEFPNLPQMRISVEQLIEEEPERNGRGEMVPKFSLAPLPKWLKDFNFPNKAAISIVRRRK
jgi:hypothetical protein